MLSEVTVVVPHYGDPEPTLSLIDRLTRQQHVTLQIVVADDHSPVPFPETPGVEVVRRSSNGGFGSNVNSGAARARHDLLLILNSDVEFGDTFVAELVQKASPWMPAVVSPRIRQPQWDTTSGWGDTSPESVTSSSSGCTHWPDYARGSTKRSVTTRALWASPPSSTGSWSAAMLMPTAVFRAVDGFDERFFMNSEEVDLQRRLRQEGLPSVVLREPSLVHEGGGSTPRSSSRRWLVASRLTYARKWSGATGEHALRSALMSASVINLAWNLLRALGGRPTHPVATFRDERHLLRDVSGERRKTR